MRQKQSFAPPEKPSSRFRQTGKRDVSQFGGEGGLYHWAWGPNRSWKMPLNAESGRVQGRLGFNAWEDGLRLSVSWEIFDFPTQQNRATGFFGGAGWCYGLTLEGELRSASPFPFARRPFKVKGKAAGALPPHPRPLPKNRMECYAIGGKKA